jgi:hypothetical protein
MLTVKWDCQSWIHNILLLILSLETPSPQGASGQLPNLNQYVILSLLRRSYLEQMLPSFHLFLYTYEPIYPPPPYTHTHKHKHTDPLKTQICVCVHTCVVLNSGLHLESLHQPFCGEFFA